jgi:hypothetical protein
MPGGYKRKKYHHGITTEKKKYRTKRRTRDIDQIAEDLEIPEKRQKLENQPFDLDLPGGGQHYCIQCARHFIDSHSLTEHDRSKAHKKRLKDLLETPYSIEESERAGGHGSYIIPEKPKDKVQMESS